jgi:hypothetical protein
VTSFRRKAAPLLVKRGMAELKILFDVKSNFFHPQQILSDRAVYRETKMEFPD